MLGTNAAMENRNSGLNRAHKDDKEGHTKQNRAPNKAGAAEDHVVVRGERNGEVITSTRVSNLKER